MKVYLSGKLETLFDVLLELWQSSLDKLLFGWRQLAEFVNLGYTVGLGT